jgi:hypothetical protein
MGNTTVQNTSNQSWMRSTNTQGSQSVHKLSIGNHRKGVCALAAGGVREPITITRKAEAKPEKKPSLSRRVWRSLIDKFNRNAAARKKFDAERLSELTKRMRENVLKELTAEANQTEVSTDYKRLKLPVQFVKDVKRGYSFQLDGKPMAEFDNLKNGLSKSDEPRRVCRRLIWFSYAAMASVSRAA